MNDSKNALGVEPSLCLVLHTHLPYVHHPDYEDFLEEEWLFEALLETYLPLLQVFQGWERDGVAGRIAMSWTPPLLSMLATPSLQRKFEGYLERRLRLAKTLSSAEEIEFGPAVEGIPVSSREAAACYGERFEGLRKLWKAIDGDVASAFKAQQETGRVEILASSATHGFLPLLPREESRRAQIELGLELAEQTFGRRPSGFWLPECAWSEALAAPLQDAGVRWVVLDHHAVAGADPKPGAAHYRPAEIAEGLFAFGRDPAVSEQVWSSEVGYPGDPLYRELYRDVGFDTEYRFIRPFLNADGVRRNVGLKFHRVTGKVELHQKELYDWERARERTREHAADFLDSRRDEVARLRAELGDAISICAPYDTELFGHWWFEGPDFLDALFRQANDRADLGFRLATPSDVLESRGPRSRCETAFSTWGRKGYAEVWLNETNAWLWPHLEEMADRMAQRAREFVEGGASGSEERILNQMARELLLAESSDWPFIITMDTSVHYAERRFRDHCHRFFALEDALDGAEWDEEELARVERHDAIFPDIDFRLFSSLEAPPGR